MADLNRLYDFTAGQVIRSAEVDAELNQILARLNDVDADSLSSLVAEKLGLSQTGSVRSGKSIIATEESRTNAAYGTLTTPDRVSGIEVPQDGILRIAYRAMWKEGIDGAARAAVFIGSNQLKVASEGNASPVVNEALMSSAANTYGPLSSSAGGLVPIAAGAAVTAYTGDVATGQVIGLYNNGTWPVLHGSGFIECFLDPGTYDISIQFKASSGSVTVKNRKLWVRAEAY